METVPSTISLEESRQISQEVAQALARAAKRAELEAGGSEGRICPPLLAGPQRYRDPSIWGPNYRLMAEFSSYAPEEIEVMQNTPLSEDGRFKAVAAATYKLAVELGLPGVAPSK
jgi:hypothetical protein